MPSMTNWLALLIVEFAPLTMIVPLPGPPRNVFRDDELAPARMLKVALPEPPIVCWPLVPGESVLYA